MEFMINVLYILCPWHWETATNDGQKFSSSLSSTLWMKVLREADNHQNKIKHRIYHIILSARILNMDEVEKPEYRDQLFRYIGQGRCY